MLRLLSTRVAPIPGLGPALGLTTADFTLVRPLPPPGLGLIPPYLSPTCVLVQLKVRGDGGLLKGVPRMGDRGVIICVEQDKRQTAFACGSRQTRTRGSHSEAHQIVLKAFAVTWGVQVRRAGSSVMFNSTRASYRHGRSNECPHVGPTNNTNLHVRHW